MNQDQLVGWLLDQQNYVDTGKAAKATLESYPTNGCATFASLALRRSTLDPTLDVHPSTGPLVSTLLVSGWTKVPVLEWPKPGDIFVTTDDNSNGIPDHVGFVIAPIGPNISGTRFFWACDNHKNHYIRNIERTGSGRTPVAFWLRKN